MLVSEPQGGTSKAISYGQNSTLACAGQRGMVQEAAGEGLYITDYGKFPKVQILTIEDLFAGKKVDMPWADPTAFKKPAKETSPDTQGKLF